MKKMMVTLLVTSLLIASCSKDSDDNCTWTSSDGNYFGTRPPTDQEIDELESDCSCAISITKECD